MIQINTYMYIWSSSSFVLPVCHSDRDSIFLHAILFCSQLASYYWIDSTSGTWFCPLCGHENALPGKELSKVLRLWPTCVEYRQMVSKPEPYEEEKKYDVDVFVPLNSSRRELSSDMLGMFKLQILIKLLRFEISSATPVSVRGCARPPASAPLSAAKMNRATRLHAR